MQNFNAQIKSLGVPLVLGISRMTEARRVIWLRKARKLASAGVTVIDPNRRPLRILRQRLRQLGITGYLYRASSGGSRFGKSSEIIAL